MNRAFGKSAGQIPVHATAHKMGGLRSVFIHSELKSRQKRFLGQGRVTGKAKVGED